MLISIAIDFRHADVATRERFHLSEERLAQLYQTVRTDVITEAALISTCNRTELYAWVASEAPEVIARSVQVLARRWMRTRAEGEALLKVATRREGREAAQHIIRIAAGLESQVLGDGQILGQLKTAYKRAATGASGNGATANGASVVGHSATGPVLHRLFETALRAGKRVQTETALTAGRNSVGAEAALTAAQRFGDLAMARCVVVGAGKTGARAAKQLHKLGARDIVIVNRTFENSVTLAAMVGGRAAEWDTRHVEAAMADVVVVATGSEVPVLEAPRLATAREACANTGYALLLLDLSLPRNVDPVASIMPGVTLVDLDSLSQPVLAAEHMRREAVPQAEEICTQEVEAFLGWLANMPARAAIRPLRAALEDVARREVAYHAKDAHVAERAAARIVAKLLAGPMAALRRAVQRGEPLDQHAMMLLEMFAPNGALADVPVAADSLDAPASSRESVSRVGAEADLASLQPSLSPLP
jgi:glutamyl-tRNA reductase